MECKGIFDSQHSRIIYDLIDTLWNVKLVIDNTGFSPAADLIDTLWNVKAFSTVSTAALFMI